MVLYSEVGFQRGEPKNSEKSKAPSRKPKPSLVTKAKIPMMKMIAEMPPMKTTICTALSMYQSALRRSMSPALAAIAAVMGLVRSAILGGLFAV